MADNRRPSTAIFGRATMWPPSLSPFCFSPQLLQFITQCVGCYLPVICQWLCPERSFLFLIGFSWTQYLALNTIIYLMYYVDILLYIPHFSSILNDLWRGGEAKLLSAMAKWQITGARQLPFLAVAVQNFISWVQYCTRNRGNIKIDIILCKINY